MGHQMIRYSQLTNSASLDWYMDVFLTTNTLQSALIIVLLITACALTIYNLPWTDAELTASHRQTRTQLNRLKSIFSLRSTSAALRPQSSRHIRLDGVVLDGTVIKRSSGH